MGKKKKYLLGGAAGLVVLALILGGTFGYFKYKQGHQKKLASVATDTGSTNGSGETLGLNTQNANSGSTPLSQQQQTAANTEGANNQGNSLQTNLGQQSSSSGPKIPGPEEFGQYDQYKNNPATMFGDLQVGTGVEATPGKTVVVVYKGWLTNGTLFDESKIDKASGKTMAFEFTLGKGSVISGWEQGVPGMKVGGTRRLVIPPAFGYKAAGTTNIPPNSVLVFDVQLVQVK